MNSNLFFYFKIIAYPSTLSLLYILLYYYPLDSGKDFHSI